MIVATTKEIEIIRVATKFQKHWNIEFLMSRKTKSRENSFPSLGLVSGVLLELLKHFLISTQTTFKQLFYTRQFFRFSFFPVGISCFSWPDILQEGVTQRSRQTMSDWVAIRSSPPDMDNNPNVVHLGKMQMHQRPQSTGASTTIECWSSAHALMKFVFSFVLSLAWERVRRSEV